MSNKNNLIEFDQFYHTQLKPALLGKYSGENYPLVNNNVIKRFEKVVDYNVPHGKKMRGLGTYESVSHLIESLGDCYLSASNLNANRTKLLDQSKAIGWCIEFLQGSFLVADDIMDNSTMRRGQKCWYLNDNVGLVAINDSFYLLSSVFTVLNKFVQDHPMYIKFYEIFTDTFERTVLGQGLDLLTPPTKEYLEKNLFDFNNYTMEQYNTIVIFKTAFYSFCLPIQCALYLLGIDDVHLHKKCKEILIELGAFFQIQDDYLDCYGDPKLTGKVGTDIEEGKCSWLVVNALKRADSSQKQTLMTHYGRNEKESVQAIKNLFNQLNIDKIYREYEENQYQRIIKSIECMDDLNSDDCFYQNYFSASDAASIELKKIKLAAIKGLLKNFAQKFFKRLK